VYEGVLAVLNQAAQHLGDERLPASETRQVLEVGLRTLTLGLVPPSLDQVIVGSMDRSRHPRVRAAFILGLHDGGFPAPIREDVVFSDRDREEMAKQGIEMGPGGIERIVEQDFLSYIALSRASERLYLLRPLLDPGGKSLAESPVVTAVKFMFPGLEEARPGAVDAGGASGLSDVLSRVYTIPSALSELARLSASEETRAAGMASVLRRCVEQAGAAASLRFLQTASRRNAEGPVDSGLIRALCGGRIDLSISRLESLLACPFQHFAQHTLGLEERRAAGLDAPRGGLFMHFALTRFVNDMWLGDKDVAMASDDQVRDTMRAACDGALVDLAEDYVVEDPVALREISAMRTALEDAALTLVEHSRRGKFRPVAAEVAFGRGSPLALEDIVTGPGLVASLTGRIDLVDAAEQDGQSYFRVIDFKSRRRRLAVADILDGMDLQLAGYAAAVLRNPHILRGREAKVAAMLYMGVRGSFTRVEAPLPLDEARKQRLSQRRMSGLVASDPAPVRLMDTFEEDRSPLVPVTLDKSGKPKESSSVIPAGQIQRLAEVFLSHARRGAEMVASGDVRISPYRRGFDTPCAYCRFGSLCQFDTSRPENRYRYMRVSGHAARKGGGEG
jgi:ATP-dependent helicase/nuclease subunit B